MSGSPPPMRGKVQLFPQVPQWTGITPAYAGKSFRKTAVRHAIKDHPRLCGEKASEVSSVLFSTGSPPPMRGKVMHRKFQLPADGITPAYAGKRSGMLRRLISCRDHPRLCGEKGNTVHWCETLKGSPPPMRGKEAAAAKKSIDTRITPAYAGKSIICPSGDLVVEDHPRLCGEKAFALSKWIRQLGSPPPMRGKGQTTSVTRVPCRITPAYAGKRSDVLRK